MYNIKALGYVYDLGLNMGERSVWHHYIPQGVLKRFCYRPKKIWYYSKKRPEEGVDSRDILKKFRKRHYYSLEDSSGKKTDILEREFLQVLDSRFCEFIEEFINIISNGSTPKIDLSTRQFLQQFVYYYTKRNPDFAAKLGIYNEPENEVIAALDSYESKFGKIDQSARNKYLLPDKVRSLTEYARVQSLARQSPVVNKRLDIMSLHFAFAPPNKQFLIGSNPVVRLENKKNASLGDGDVEIWTPISPNILIGFAGPGAKFKAC